MLRRLRDLIVLDLDYLMIASAITGAIFFGVAGGLWLAFTLAGWV